MASISYFNTGSTVDTSLPLEKKACLFYEAGDGGIHKDSKGREHKVDEEYLRKLEKNTNSAIANGESIYLINNHKKDDFNDTYGYLDSNVYVKTIDEKDAEENPKLKSLIGRLALFADKVKITSDNLKRKIKEGIKFPNISIGLDMTAMRLKEISMTAMPALANASLFQEHQEDSNFMGVSGVTMAEVMANKYKKESNYEEIEELLKTFLNVVDNLKYTRDEDLTGGTREAFYQQAIEDFVAKLTDLTEIGPDPGYASQTAVQDTINREHTYAQENGRPQVIGYNNMDINAFTMSDAETSKFSMKGVDAEFIEIRLGRKKKKKGLLRKALGLGAAAALGAGALRYGSRAKLAMAGKLARSGKKLGFKEGLKEGLSGAGSLAKKDIKSGIAYAKKKYTDLRPEKKRGTRFGTKKYTS